MKFKIKAMECLCALTSSSNINGIFLDCSDFGDTIDLDPSGAEPYGCGDMTFVPKKSTDKVLKKYDINEDEYKKICEELQCLSFGTCSYCV